MVETQQTTVFDTDQQLLGNVYAKALVGFGTKNGTVESLVDELSAVVGVLDELPKLRLALEAPRIPLEAKSKLLESAFGSKVSPELLNFLKIIAGKGRFGCLAAIQQSAREIQDEMLGRVQAILTTADEIDDAARERIASRLTDLLGKQVVLSTNVDAGIIGGVVVRVGDTVYDASIANQLEQVRSKAVKRATDAIRQQLDRFTSA
jgi:F-type H+-transporting ATPase subunit delta